MDTGSEARMSNAVFSLLGNITREGQVLEYTRIPPRPGSIGLSRTKTCNNVSSLVQIIASLFGISLTDRKPKRMIYIHNWRRTLGGVV